MRILFLAHRVPDRPNKGDKIRAWHELRALAARHEVHLFAPDDAGARTTAQGWEALASATVVPLGRLGAAWRTATAALNARALTAAHFAAPALRAALRRALAGQRFDGAVVYSGAMDPLLRDRPDLPRVVDLVDVDSEKFRLYHERATVTGLKRVACGVESRRLRVVERVAAETAAAVVVCTEPEAATLRSFSAPRRLEVIGNGVDLDAFSFHGNDGRAEAEILFVGALDYRANIDACVHLVQDVLPRIRRGVPDATVTLVGSRPAPEVRALSAAPGVALHADVPEVVPFLHRATVTVLPFRVARGIQNKALEALAAGLPLVTTGETAKGLAGVAGRDWLAADDAEGLARHVIELFRDPARRAELAAGGRRLVEARYSWNDLLARFVAVVEESFAGAPRRLPGARA